MLFGRAARDLLPPPDTLSGRDEPILSPEPHAVHGRPIVPPWPEGLRELIVGAGCFWGVERIYWELEGVWTTAVGYGGGDTPHPTYGEVCSGRTNHAEVALAVYDPAIISFEQLLVPFWEQHDPTTAMRQGNDVGTQYRSQIQVADDEERQIAEASRERYQQRLAEAGHGDIVTEIVDRRPFYYAEAEHQQYLHVHPGGYCNHGLCQVRYA